MLLALLPRENFNRGSLPKAIVSSPVRVFDSAPTAAAHHKNLEYEHNSDLVALRHCSELSAPFTMRIEHALIRMFSVERAVLGVMTQGSPLAV
jgi:hypothetical protein